MAAVAAQTIASASTPEAIEARIERLPPSRWHVWVRVVLGAATFFDSFDAVAIAFVIPTLVGAWHLEPRQIGLVLSSGFAGQLVGAALFGRLAERYGRMSMLNVTLWVIGVFGLACAFSWDLWSLMAFRFLQGIGIGGEVPIAATYVNEIAKAARRGRFVLLYQSVYGFGIMGASLGSIYIVPVLGWNWMFIIGAVVPLLVAIFLLRSIPESPRWLAAKGRLREAEQAMAKVEDKVSRHGAVALPPPGPPSARVTATRTSVRELFTGIYTVRTLSVWVMWFAAAMIGFGLLVWLPTIFRTVYQMSVKDSLIYGSVANTIIVCVPPLTALVIDRYGRRALAVFSFVCAALPLLALGAIAQPSAITMMVLAAIASGAIAIVQGVQWVYTPEIYPTRLRATGAGAASAWARASSMIAPNIVGFLLPWQGASAVFLTFGIVGIVGAAIVHFFCIETRGRVLEEVSP